MSDKSFAMNAVCVQCVPFRPSQVHTHNFRYLTFHSHVSHRIYSNTFISAQEVFIDHNGAVKSFTVTVVFTDMCWHCMFCCSSYLGHFCLILTENKNVDMKQHIYKKESLFVIL